MQPSRWQLTQFTGTFASADLTGACDVRQPGQGIGSLQLGHAPIANGQILGAGFHLKADRLEQSVQEVFARGSDLAAIYAPTEAFPFRAQAYWRLDSHPRTVEGAPAISAIELVASTQTDLLDSCPDIVAATTLPVESIWQLSNAASGTFDAISISTGAQRFSRPGATGCFVFRLAKLPYSYAEMVYPLDFESSEFDCFDEQGVTIARVSHHLFAHRLEKGVVLRSRVLGLWLERAGDLTAAAAHYQQFAHSEPPLTA